jgi:signal transduction histidine kinase
VLIGAAVFPLLHLWLHANFVVDPGLKRAHAFLVLVMLALLGAVATAIYTWLGRRHEALAQASRRLEAQLREAQRLEAAGRLSGGVAHDFNNLLTTITGYNEMAIDRLPEGDPSRFALEEIRKASARASALTTQLLAFSRRQVLKPERISLNAIVEQVRPMLARLIGEDVTLQTRLAPDLGDVTADPVQIQSVLLTLAANARDAMAGGGTLTIGTADDSPRASVRLIVQDTGGGIPDELRPHVFEPFYAVGPRGAGLGLGLAAVHGIVTQSGGTVDVESGPGRGTTFVIRLPRAR